jgi:asparagine synthetase B (glutamine-hydrolysing)
MLPARKKGASCITASPTCSIVGIFDAATDAVELRQKARKMSALQRHRGPDWSGTHVVDDGDFTSAIAHERLSIVDPDSGEQPLFSKDGTISLAANGEIYNHRELKEGPLAGAYFSSGSDCEVMIPLYEKYGPCAEMVRIRAPQCTARTAQAATRKIASRGDAPH